MEVWAKEQDVWFSGQEEDVALALIFPFTALLDLADREDALRIKRLYAVFGLVHRLLLCLDETDDATYSDQELREKREAIPILFKELAQRRALVLEAHEVIGLGCTFEEEILPRLKKETEPPATADGPRASL